ncbi:MAG: AAA family ATPase [Myxococcales bacterium]|nr:AAA family ATPase [Myxococcales bacterium]
MTSISRVPDVSPAAYSSPLDHLLHHFERVRLWLRRYLLIYPERQTTSEGEPSHLYVSRAEMERFLGTRPPGDLAELVAIEGDLERLEAQIQERVEVSSLEGVLLPLEELRASFQLSNDGLNLLIAALAPEFEAAFTRAYTHAWCDFTQKRTTVGFLLELLGRYPEDRDRIRGALDEVEPLVRYRLIEFRNPSVWGDSAPLIHRYVKVADRIVKYLRGQVEPPPTEYGSFARLRWPQRTIESVLVPEATKQQLRHLLTSGYRSKKRALRIFFYGPQGCGKKSLAEAFAGEMSRPVLLLDLQQVPLSPEAYYLSLVSILREAQLHGADIYVDHGEVWREEKDHELVIRLFSEALQWYPGTVYFSADQALPWLNKHLSDFVSVQVPYPTSEVQRELWLRFLPPDLPLAGGLDVDEIVKRYSLAGGGIRQSVHEVVERLRLRDRKDHKIYRDELYTSIRNNLKHQLGDLAIAISNAYDWTDLILPDETKEKLEGILNYFRHQAMIMRDWGFGGKLLYGKGLSALFSGPSGTGKSMAAAIIARKLGMEMFQIDLSRVVNKYIGETEKNLGKIFDEASRGQAVLLFDEADSLFSKRTEVKSSTDRYANLEVNYLLQRMEHFEGISILTTNLESALDEAFTRRIRFRIKFPFPDAEQRALLWKSMVPPEAPVDSSLDLDWIAKDYDMAGGNIKKALVRAAILAAERGVGLSYGIIKEAADKEFTEMGKVVRKGTADEY